MVAPRSLATAVRQVLGSSRPLSWVNTAYPFGAAYLLGGGAVDAVFWIGVVYFLVPYNLLMYGVNDVFDYESDLRNPRKGGVEGLVLTDRWHGLVLATAALVNLPFVAVLVAAGTVRSTLVLAVVLFAVVAYSAPRLRFKERPLVDSLTSSSHFVGPALFGYVLVAGQFDTTAVAVFAAFFCWGVASQAFGAVQDISADVGAGIASVATWLGRSASPSPRTRCPGWSCSPRRTGRAGSRVCLPSGTSPTSRRTARSPTATARPPTPGGAASSC
jgi:4-hydroxybenzoate polyprenyltransferase